VEVIGTKSEHNLIQTSQKVMVYPPKIIDGRYDSGPDEGHPVHEIIKGWVNTKHLVTKIIAPVTPVTPVTKKIGMIQNAEEKWPTVTIFNENNVVTAYILNQTLMEVVDDTDRDYTWIKSLENKTTRFYKPLIDKGSVMGADEATLFAGKLEGRVNKKHLRR